MALDKAGLKGNIVTMLEELTETPDRDQAIEKFATDLSNAIDTYVKTATIYATPVDVTGAAMVAGGSYAVASTNNLNSNIQ